LIEQMGAQLVEAAFVINLPDIGGMARLQAQGVACHALTEFEGD